MLLKAICTAWDLTNVSVIHTWGDPVTHTRPSDGIPRAREPGHQLRWPQLSQSCISRRDRCTKAALGPRSPWRFCEGSAGMGCSGGITFQTLSFQRHTCLWLRSHGALCSYFPLYELPSKADMLLAPSDSDQEDCPYIVKCLGSKENIQNPWVKRTSLNSHFPCFN